MLTNVLNVPEKFGFNKVYDIFYIKHFPVLLLKKKKTFVSRNLGSGII
jgi:hypothetical protein